MLVHLIIKKEVFMLEKILIKHSIKKYRKKNADYYEGLEKKDKYVLIKNKSYFQYLYLVPKSRGIVLNIRHNEIFDKKMIKKIIECFPNTEIILCEYEKLLTNDDIKDLSKISRKLIINTQYFERNLMSQNEIYSCDIETFLLIIQKVEFINNICKNNFTSQSEQFMFILTQILKYIQYKDFHDFRTCMANSILLGTGVCMDFAIALYKCLTDLGIECEIIKGIGRGHKEDLNSHINLATIKSHAWNQVKIDNTWYNIDITWFLNEKDFDWLLSSDNVFTKEYTHLTNEKYHVCNHNYDKAKVKELYNRFMKYDSLWKRFDKGDTSETLEVIK